MKEPYIEGLANHDDPESCVGLRKDVGEALTGERIGEVLSREINSGVPTLLSEREGHIETNVMASSFSDPTRSETLCMCERSLHGNREIPRLPGGLWQSGPHREG